MASKRGSQGKAGINHGKCPHLETTGKDKKQVKKGLEINTDSAGSQHRELLERESNGSHVQAVK